MDAKGEYFTVIKTQSGSYDFKVIKADEALDLAKKSKQVHKDHLPSYSQVSFTLGDFTSTSSSKGQVISIDNFFDKNKAELGEFRDKMAVALDKRRKSTGQGIKDASEEIGEIASEAFIKKIDPNAKLLTASLPGGQKNGEFDMIYEGSNGEIYIIEAKGNTSELGSRVAVNLEEGEHGAKERVAQGSRAYMMDIIANMEKAVENTSGEQRKKLQETIMKIREADEDGIINYLAIRQRVNDNGTLGKLEVTKFDVPNPDRNLDQ